MHTKRSRDEGYEVSEKRCEDKENVRPVQKRESSPQKPPGPSFLQMIVAQLNFEFEVAAMEEAANILAEEALRPRVIAVDVVEAEEGGEGIALPDNVVTTEEWSALEGLDVLFEFQGSAADAGASEDSAAMEID